MLKILSALFIFIIILTGCRIKNSPADANNDNNNDGDNPSIITNGDFETATNNRVPDSWIENIVGSPSFKYFSVDKTQATSGTSSVKIQYIDSLANADPANSPWGGLYQVLPINHLFPGTQYYLKFSIKSMQGNVQIRLLRNGDSNFPILSYIATPEQKWVDNTIGFKTDSETNFLWIVINTKQSMAQNGEVLAWVDNFRITTTP